MTADINEPRHLMYGALKSLHTEFGGLRTDRANATQGKGKFTVIRDKKAKI